MRRFRNRLAIAGLTLAFPLLSSAQSFEELRQMSPDDRRAYLDSMSADERSAMQTKWRGEYQDLSDEEKLAYREERRAEMGERGPRGRSAMRERWNSMSDEERAAMREQRKATREERRAKWDSMNEEERAAAREKRGQRMGPRHHRGKQDRSGGEDQ